MPSSAATSPPPSSPTSSSSSRTRSPSFPSLPPLRPSPLFDVLCALLQFPSPDAAAVRDQAILSATGIVVAALPSSLPVSTAPHLESLTEVLLAVANRPNHGPDRLSCALACESLRELERANPLLLSDVAGHLWALAQAERTHAAQSYLLAAVVRNITLHGLLSSPSSILSTSTPLVPFSVPQSLFPLTRISKQPILHGSQSSPLCTNLIAHGYQSRF